MAIRRPLPPRLFLFATLGVLALLSPAAPAAAGETRTLRDKNVRWTLPDTGGWAFQEVDAKAKDNGFVAVVVGSEVSTRMDLMVKPTQGLPVRDFLQEVTGYARKAMQKVEASKGFRGKLSGLDAEAVWLYGKRKGGVEVHVSIYVVVRDAKFYLLLVRAYHGAHRKAWENIDAARRGVRLIEGAGPEEPAAKGPPEDAGGDSAIGDAGGPGDEALPPEKWPEHGPKWEDGTIVCPHQNLRLTLPEGTPFQVTGVAKDESELDQPLVFLLARLGEGDAAERCRVSVAVLRRQPGYLTRMQVNDSGYQESVAKLFHERLPGRALLEEEIEIGGVTGSAFGLRGKTEQGAYVAVTDDWVALRGVVYRVRFVVAGSRDAPKAFGAPIRALLGGVHFPETREPVAGPLAGAVPFHVAPRGNYLTKSYVVKAPGMEVRKPEGFGKLTNLQGQNLSWAFETRTEDGQAYLYLDLAVFDTAVLSRNQIDLEDLIEQRSSAWSEQATGAVKLRKGRKEKGALHFKAKWGKAKGVGYRFEAEFLGAPFVENGYLVRHKQRTYFIRAQYGGVDAEKRFKKTLKGLMKTWKWLKK